MEINERIKQRRLKLGLSLNDVAKACGVSKTTVYKYETSAIKSMSSDVLVPLAKALKCSELYLLCVTDDPRPIEIKTKMDSDAIWDEEVGTRDFTDEELKELMDYAKYIISKRKR